MSVDGDRAVSTLIGFILLFGFVVISFSVYQGMVVPDQNKATEFEHNKQVQSQLQELRNAFVSAARENTKRSVAIKLGADYPRRTFAQNLGVSGGGVGTFEYDGGSDISIDNATATDLYGETNDFWNGTQHNYSSQGLLYRPLYSFYSNAPETVYENTIVFNDFGQDRNVSITDQALIEGKRITLVALVGNLSKSGQGTVSIDPESVSASSTTVSVRNTTGDRVNITIPTRLNASTWEEILRDDEELVADGGAVTAVKNTGPDEVSIVLEQGNTYELRMAKVGVGAGISEENATYLTLRDRPSPTVLNDTSHFIELEVRDRFNNPVAGETVSGSVISGSGSFEANSVDSSTTGVAVFNYTSPSSSDSIEVAFDIDGSTAKAKNVTFNMSVREYP